MRLCFQADANINPAIGRGVKRREPLIDFRAAAGTIPDGTSDPDVLRIAAESGRVLVSADVTTMPGHFARFIVEHESPGLLLFSSGTSIGEVIDGLIVAWLNWTGRDLRNQAWWLS